MEKNCTNCIHQIVCKAWKKEIDSAEECYTGENFVTIYDRYNTNGDKCEYYSKD
jgi:hypothetical protein